MCWLELSKGFITNNLFVKRILFSCSWNIHEQEHCFLKCIYLKCSSGSFKWITEGLACKWFLLFSCTWANKPPGIDCFARLLHQQQPSCANRVWGVSVCVNATAGLPQLLRGQPSARAAHRHSDHWNAIAQLTAERVWTLLESKAIKNSNERSMSKGQCCTLCDYLRCDLHAVLCSISVNAAAQGQSGNQNDPGKGMSWCWSGISLLRRCYP